MLTCFLSAILVAGLEPPTTSSHLNELVRPHTRAQEQESSRRADDDKKGSGLAWRYGQILRIEVEASVQEDLHESYDEADAKPGFAPFSLERSRVGVQGALFKHIEFEVAREVSERDAEAGTRAKSPWRDVNVNLTYLKNAQVQLGMFKLPFGRDALTASIHNDFVYRSLGADYLAPGRDTGVMVHGRFFKRGLSYWTGVFRHDGDNARSAKVLGADRTFATRITGTPLRQLRVAGLDGLELGSAFTVSSVSDEDRLPQGLRGRTVMTQDTFFQPVYVNGLRRRVEADLSWAVGPASMRAEYTRVLDDRLRQGFADEDLPAARYRSWYVGGTFLLTGESKRRSVRPRHDFARGGIGALEAVARYEHLWFDSVGGAEEPVRNPRAETIYASGEHVFTGGLNWILNRYVTLQLNAIRESVSDPERNPSAGKGAFWSRVLRFQFAL